MEKIVKTLSELVRPDKNIRIHTEKQLVEFEKSVRMFGQLRPIVIDEGNKILAGNGLYETLLRMGEQVAECYQYSDLTENQKKKLMIADNKIFSLGIENLETLNDFLTDLQGDLEIPGFDEEILKQMMADAEEVTEKIEEYGTLDEEEIRAIREKRVESYDEKPQAGTTEEESGQDEAENSEDSDRSGEERDCVICPKCGEKIWL